MPNYDCETCKKPCLNKARSKNGVIFGAPCDGCKLIFCKLCASLSTTEADAVALSQRNLIFFCQDCKTQLKDLPGLNLKKIINRLDTQKLECREKDAQIEILQNQLRDTALELRGEIDRLLSENTQQIAYIKRLRRSTQDFEDIALTAEQESNSKIETQLHEIHQLKSEIIQLLDSNRSQTTLVAELDSKVRTLEAQSKDQELQKCNLSNKITDLTLERDILLNGLKKTKYELIKNSAENQESNHAENSYATKLEKQNDIVGALRDEIDKHVSVNAVVESTNKNLKAELMDLQTLCQEMVSTIRTLESDNHGLSAELARIAEGIRRETLNDDSDEGVIPESHNKEQTNNRKRTTISTQTMTCFKDATSITSVDDDTLNEALLLHSLLRIQIPKSTQTESAVITASATTQQENASRVAPLSAKQGNALQKEITETTVVKNNILLMGDSSVADLSRILQRHQDLDHFEITSIVKHNARMENISENIEQLTKHFTKKDFVIVSGGVRNALTDSKISEVVYSRLSLICKYTNLIVLSIPLWRNRVVLNRFIDQINIQLFEFIQAQASGHTFININSFLGSSSFNVLGNKTKYRAKLQIGERISNVIQDHFLF